MPKYCIILYYCIYLTYRMFCVKSQLRKRPVIFTIRQKDSAFIVSRYNGFKNKSLFRKLIDPTFSCVSFHITACWCRTVRRSRGSQRLVKERASSYRSCILLIAVSPSSWIRSRNLRPTSPDIGERRDAGGRCIIGSIAFSSERFPIPSGSSLWNYWSRQ